MNDSQYHHLSPEDRARVTAQVDHFIEVLEKRYGLDANEVVDLLQWVKQKRSRGEKLSQAGAISLIGLVVTAVAMMVVEGVKEWVRHLLGR